MNDNSGMLQESQESFINKELKESVSRKSLPYKKYVVGLILLFILHFIIGTASVPNIVFQAAKGASELVIRVGYGLGTMIIFAIPFPFLISLLSLLARSKRNYYSFFKILFSIVLLTLFANGLYQFFILNFVLK